MDWQRAPTLHRSTHASSANWKLMSRRWSQEIGNEKLAAWPIFTANFHHNKNTQRKLWTFNFFYLHLFGGKKWGMLVNKNSVYKPKYRWILQKIVSFDVQFNHSHGCYIASHLIFQFQKKPTKLGLMNFQFKML